MSASNTRNLSPEAGQRRLEIVLHHMLVAGVYISSALMLLGLVLSVVQLGGVPDRLPEIRAVLPLALALEPAGLLALGLITLIATPILRVAGSVIGFLYEHDWLYAFITFIVFLIVMASILLGKE